MSKKKSGFSYTKLKDLTREQKVNGSKTLSIFFAYAFQLFIFDIC